MDSIPTRSTHPPAAGRLTELVVGSTPLIVGACSGFLARDGIRSWYRTIRRPSWDPPEGVFGPVWTTLYATMGLALGKVVRADDTDAKRVALTLFSLQLVLNGAWSWIFFVRHDLRGALIESVALWLAVAATVVAFWRIRPGAGVLLLPYLAWTGFATVLTAEIWRRNRQPL